MGAAPSTAAWVALAVLVLTFAAGAVTVERKRPEPVPRSGVQIPRWLFPTATTVAFAPSFVALTTGAPEPTLAWWLIVGPPAGMTLGVVVATAWTVAGHWRRWRRQLQARERPRAYLVFGVMTSGALCLPLVPVVVVVLGADPPLAVALALLIAYYAWHAGCLLLSRWPSGRRLSV
jgi:hypothetical protein